MANHKSAKKRARQTETRNLRNKVLRSAFRSLNKRLVQAIEENNKEDAQKLLPELQSKAAKLNSKGVFKPNTAARKVSRLTSQVNSL